jgi:sortase (surface protein transpeptidase)
VKRLPLALVALCFTAGCGQAPAAESPGPTAPDASITSAEVAAPEWLEIPAIGAESSLVPLGLTADGQHEVPPLEQQHQAGWFEPGPEPGQPGPAIILGHVNGDGKPGVFARLTEVAVGDEVLVDGRAYRVYEVLTADKDAFPRDRVYGNTDRPELRVITCGGAFDENAASYEDNVIVFAA